MSWIAMLAKTYDHCPHLHGRRMPGEPETSIPLLLVGQTTQNAHIDVLLDENANLLSAEAIADKPSQVTIIPCTEGSVGRTSTKIAPHPLHDKLQYVAADYVAFGGEKKAGWTAYIDQLDAWCASAFAHPKVRVVRDYLKKGRLISDLVQAGIMVAENGKLIKTPNEQQKKAHPLLNISGLVQSDAFIRFRVHLKGDTLDKLWMDNSVTESFTSWQESLSKNKGLCYVSGQNKTISHNHPAKIRHTGDSAKLISANDSSGFTYAGRFLSDQQAVSVSYEITQKAHNMLRWLIAQHGYRNDSQVFVAWGTELQTLPNISKDSEELFGSSNDIQVTRDENFVQNLRREYAQRLKKSMAGYGSNINDSHTIIVIGLDAATPGRMSIIFYRELSGSDFLKRISAWHEQCCWLHYYKFVGKQRVPFIGAPSPKEIAYAAYGSNASEKIVKGVVERLMRCIVDGKPIPPAIRQNLVRRAGNPEALENWEWQKIISIACAVIMKHQYEQKGGAFTLALDEKSQDRSYQFGRLLAYAQYTENLIQFLTDKSHRQTNAERMMHQFTLRPAKTWEQLKLKLLSYQRQLKNHALVNHWNTKMNEIVDSLGHDGFTNAPLSEQYLLGYSSQMMALQNRNKTNESEELDNVNI